MAEGHLSVVGKSVPRKEGPSKATGQAAYTVDLRLPGMLYGRILRTPLAHAWIRNIDTARAEKMKGVAAVATGQDLGGRRFGRLLHRPDLWDEPPLATEKVRYVGEGVVAVAATELDLAEAALAAVEVEYEELPAVCDPLKAMEPGAPELHPGKANNVAHRVFLNFGNIDQGLAASDLVLEDCYTTQTVPVAPLEPSAALASLDASGRLTLWSSTQSPFILRRWLSLLLDFPLDKIRVIKPHLGGGFGVKRDLLATDCCSALLAIKSGRPVKVVNDREEEFLSGRFRHPMIAYLKTGVKRDGTLTAQSCRLILDNGAYNSAGPEILRAIGGYLTALYRCPHVRYEGTLVYTNKPVNGAYRGFGNPQLRFAAESMLDEIATKLGLDPVEIRLKNVHHTGDVTANKWLLTSCGLEECIREAAARAGWQEKRGKLPFGKGIGIACGNHNSGTRSYFPHDSSAAFVKVAHDGSVHILSGAADLGQGSDSTLCQIAAEALGVPYEAVSITSADTEITPEDLGTYASRLTYIAGNAVVAAASDAKEQMKKIAAELLEAESADLEFKGGRAFVRGSPDKGVSIAEIAAAGLAKEGRHILGRGFYDPPHTETVNPDTGEGNYSPAYAFGAQVAEVEVDLNTGEVRVMKIVAAQDCGRAINPRNLEGQIEGCLAQGMGMTLSEEMIREEGLTLNGSFLGSGLPRAEQMPDTETMLIETIDPGGPFGAKGVSEMPTVPVPAAIANAVYDAIGIRFKELPIRPEKVLRALEASKRDEA